MTASEPRPQRCICVERGLTAHDPNCIIFTMPRSERMPLLMREAGIETDPNDYTKSAPLPEELQAEPMMPVRPDALAYKNASDSQPIGEARYAHRFHPAEEPPAELKEALDDFADAFYFARIEAHSCAITQSATLYEDAKVKESTARSALVALFDRQREESIRWTTEVPDPEWWAPQSLVTKLERQVASLESQIERLTDELARRVEVVQRNIDLNVELERLKAEQLTHQEREAVFQFWDFGATRGNHSGNDHTGPPPGPLTPYINTMGLVVGLLRRLSQSSQPTEELKE